MERLRSLSECAEVTSDDRVKHNEQPIVGALETLSKITPKKYIKTTEMYDANHDFELDESGNPLMKMANQLNIALKQVSLHNKY